MPPPQYTKNRSVSLPLTYTHHWKTVTVIFIPQQELTPFVEKDMFCNRERTMAVNTLLLFRRSVVSNSFVTPRTEALQARLSMGFSRQEYWSGLPFPPPGDRPDPGIKPASLALAGRFFTTEPPGKPLVNTWSGAR